MKLTDSNFLLYAARHYTNEQCHDMDEFHDDVNRYRHIKKLLGRYYSKGELRERLILNHLIVTFNVFDPRANVNMLFYRIDEKYWPALKTFLLFLNFMPDHITHPGTDELVPDSSIQIDVAVAAALGRI